MRPEFKAMLEEQERAARLATIQMLDRGTDYFFTQETLAECVDRDDRQQLFDVHGDIIRDWVQGVVPLVAGTPVTPENKFDIVVGVFGSATNEFRVPVLEHHEIDDTDCYKLNEYNISMGNCECCYSMMPVGFQCSKPTCDSARSKFIYFRPQDKCKSFNEEPDRDRVDPRWMAAMANQQSLDIKFEDKYFEQEQDPFKYEPDNATLWCVQPIERFVEVSIEAATLPQQNIIKTVADWLGQEDQDVLAALQKHRSSLNQQQQADIDIPLPPPYVPPNGDDEDDASNSDDDYVW